MPINGDYLIAWRARNGNLTQAQAAKWLQSCGIRRGIGSWRNWEQNRVPVPDWLYDVLQRVSAT